MPVNKRSMRALIAAVLLLAACEPGEKVAGGTGTHTGNTVSVQAFHGRVLTLDGAPSIRTRVILRPIGYVPETAAPYAGSGAALPDGWETTTDSAGGFFLAADTGIYMLECSRETGSGSQVAWLEGIRLDGDGGDMHRELGDIRMTQASELTGSLKADSGISLSAVEFWAGFPGTEHYSRMDIDGRFRLKGIAPGARTLEIRRRMPGFPGQRFSVSGWITFPGTLSVMEPLALPPMAPAQGPAVGDTVLSISAVACPEDVSSLVESAYPGPTAGGETRVLRTVMMSNPPQWIELDPCLGVWRSLMPLPIDAAAISDIFSSPDADYFIMANGKTLFRIGRDGGQSSYALATQPLSGAEFYAGRFYAMGMAGDKLKTYADFDSLWKNLPRDSVDIGVPVTSLNDIAIDSGIAYFGMRSDTTRIRDFNLAVGSGSKSILTGAGSHPEGMVSAPDGGLYLLNGLKQLDAFDPRTATRKRRYQVVTPYPIRGLTRYRPAGKPWEMMVPEMKLPVDTTPAKGRYATPSTP
jgi:hypothetical protein